MQNLYPEIYYSVDDLYEAFDLGLETAFLVLEKTKELSYDDQVCILNEIKRRIYGDKILDFKKEGSFPN
jgi:hypothetical protein